MFLRDVLRLTLAAAFFLGSPLAEAGLVPPDASFFNFLTPKVTPAQLRTLAHFPAFSQGPRSGPTVNILFIPGCPHCRALWHQLQVLRKTEKQAAQYHYRWIPVLVSPASAGLLLPYWNTARNGQALAQLMTHDQMNGPLNHSEPVLKLQTELKPSLVWLQGTGAQMAPALIRTDAKPVQLHLGDPSPAILQYWLGIYVH